MTETPAGPTLKLVVMGVSGSGKSTLAQALAERIGARLIEGDNLHPPANHAKMARGIALDDDDRWPWLDHLGDEFASIPGDVIATCSALKRRYRDRLRVRAPGLRFVCLAITPAEAEQRVTARAGHYFPAGLVATQFDAFEAPIDEADVLIVPAHEATAAQADATLRWLRPER